MKTKRSSIYVRIIRNFRQPTVLCVGKNGQKTYWQNGRELGYSSAQQGRYSFIVKLCKDFGVPLADFDFYYDKDNKQASKGISLENLDHIEALVRGYADMALSKKVRESPFSVSAMTPIHEKLAGIGFDTISVGNGLREKHVNLIVNNSINNPTLKKKNDATESADTDGDQTETSVQPEKEEKLDKWSLATPEETNAWLENYKLTGKDPTAPTLATNDKKVLYGTYDRFMSIDLTRLFMYNNDNRLKKEIDSIDEAKLIEKGWIPIETKLYGKCLIAPQTYRDLLMQSIADSAVTNEITSNQSSNLASDEIIAIIVSDDASNLGYAAYVSETDNGVEVIFDETIENTKVFLTPHALSHKYYTGFDRTHANFANRNNAIDYIEQELRNFDYEGI